MGPSRCIIHGESEEKLLHEIYVNLMIVTVVNINVSLLLAPSPNSTVIDSPWPRGHVHNSRTKSRTLRLCDENKKNEKRRIFFLSISFNPFSMQSFRCLVRCLALRRRHLRRNFNKNYWFAFILNFSFSFQWNFLAAFKPTTGKSWNWRKRREKKRKKFKKIIVCVIVAEWNTIYFPHKIAFYNSSLGSLFQRNTHPSPRLRRTKE